MQGGAEIPQRVLRAALLRRAPLWVAGALPWCALRSVPGLVAWCAWCTWDGVRLHRRAAREWHRWLDDAVPELEDSSALLVEANSPLARLQRERLLARVDASLGAAALRRLVRNRVRLGAGWLALSAGAAALAWMWTLKPQERPGNAAPLPPGVAAAAPKSELLLRVAPPRYTGAAATETAPRDLQAPEFSEVQWCVKDGDALDAPIELSNGQALAAGQRCVQWIATESVFWRWHGARYNLKVVPDEPPGVTISSPSEMVHELGTGATRAAMAVKVSDDYRVRLATLHLTLARGSGENIRFSDREMPLPESADPRVRAWSKQWTLAELGMEPGDELYFFVRATDNAPKPHTVQSPTFTLRLPAPVEAADEETAALPMLAKPESLRSQRQVIIDTEQLVADLKARPHMDTALARERSEAIASDQAALRRRYGQFLGEESTLFGGGDHDEHDGDHGSGKQDVLHEFGHAHDQAENATLFDDSTKKVLRRALAAMWDAERALRAIAPDTALAPEHKALDAVKELQQADRIYLHKTAFVPPPIKEDKRMTGDVVGSASYKREQEGAVAKVPQQLRQLVQALSAEGPLPALWTRTAQDWVRERIANDEQRLAAQRAIQDVADGCAPCRATLRAWLRGAIGQAPVLLQANPAAHTAFDTAWRSGDKK
jgi:hypothetical protein